MRTGGQKPSGMSKLSRAWLDIYLTGRDQGASDAKRGEHIFELHAVVACSCPAWGSGNWWLASRRELGEEGLRRLHVKRIQALGEPGIDGGKEIAGLSSLALLGP